MIRKDLGTLTQGDLSVMPTDAERMHNPEKQQQQKNPKPTTGDLWSSAAEKHGLTFNAAEGADAPEQGRSAPSPHHTCGPPSGFYLDFYNGLRTLSHWPDAHSACARTKKLLDP